MAIAPKSDHADVPVMVGRRSTRLSVAVPINISGTDSAGNEFRENTFTLNVNKHGAEIATNRLLGANAEITIENSTLGRKARAKVVQRREKRTPNSPYEVSLELLDPENIWGVRFPPADWANGQNPAGSTERSDVKPAPATRVANGVKEHSAPPEQANASSDSNGSTPAFAVTPGTTELPQEIVVAKTQATEETTRDLESPLTVTKSEPPAESAAEENPVPSEAPAAAAVAAIASPSAEAVAAQEAAQSAQGVGARLKELLGQLEEASARLEEQLAKVTEARAGLQSDAERLRAEIRQAGEQAAGSAIMDFRSKLSSEWDAATGPLFEETKRRLASDVSAAVAAFGKEAGAHLSRLTQESGPELEAKQKQAVSMAREQIARAADAAVGEFNLKLGKSAEEVSAAQHSAMKTAADRSRAEETSHLAEFFHEQAEGLLTGDRNPLPRLREQMQAEVAEAGLKFKEACVAEADKSRAGVQEELMKSVTAITKAAEEANAGLWESSRAIKHDVTFKGEKVRNHLAEIASASEEGFKNYTQVLVKGAQEEVREGLRVIAARTAQEFSGELQKAIEGQLESLGPQLQKQAGDAVELCRGNFENASRESLAETQTRLAALARQSSEAFSSELRSLAGQFKDQLRFTLEEFRATMSEEMRARLREVAEEEQKSASSRIQAEGKAARERLVTEIKDSAAKTAAEGKAAGDRVVAEINDRAAKAAAEGERTLTETKERTESAARQAADTVYKQIGIATVTLKDWGDQAAARLEAQFQKAMTTFEKQVQELTSRSLESSRKQAEATTEETRKRLEQATRILRGEVAGESK